MPLYNLSRKVYNVCLGAEKQSNSSQVVRQVPATDQARVRFPAIAFPYFYYFTQTMEGVGDILEKYCKNLPEIQREDSHAMETIAVSACLYLDRSGNKGETV